MIKGDILLASSTLFLGGMAVGANLTYLYPNPEYPASLSKVWVGLFLASASVVFLLYASWRAKR